MNEFLQKFIDDTLGRIEEFRRDGNTEDASAFAQSLERTALFLGATGLAAAAQDLRDALAQTTGQGGGGHAAAEASGEQLDRVARELQALDGQRNGPPSEPAESISSRSATGVLPVDGGDARNIRLAVDEIRVGKRLRGLDEARVAMLESSIQDIGLQTPITVAPDEVRGWCLVAGMHRLEATRRLGRPDIACRVIGRSEPAARLWEIDENLVRSELTQLERDQHLLRRKQIFDEWVISQTGRTPPDLGGRGNKGFATDTEDKTGIAKRRVNESVRRATQIDEEVQDAVRRMPAADVRVELDALASLDREQQKTALAKVERGEAVNFRAAGRQIRGVREKDETERRFKELQSAWKGAGVEARTRFLVWLRGTAEAEMRAILRPCQDPPPENQRLRINYVGAGNYGATRKAT
jgi:uncharacterized ParB-like nuclease family protein